MNHLLHLHVHSCFASWSTSDKSVSREFQAGQYHGVDSYPFASALATLTDQQRRNHEWIGVVEIDGRSHLISETSDLPTWRTYYAADTEHYWADLNSGAALHGHHDLTDKVAHYRQLGFDTAYPATYQIEYDAKLAADDAETTARRTAEQYVFVHGSADVDRAGHQGGLSDALFGHPKIQSYLTERTYDGKVCVFGYLGNSNRRVALDRHVEAHLRNTRHWNDLQIAVWITSSDGRHMADSYEEPGDCDTWSFTDYSADEDPVPLPAGRS